MTRTMLLALALFGACAVFYGIALWLFNDRAFQILYGGKYHLYTGWPLLICGLLSVWDAVKTVLGNGLRALERPDRIFWCNLGAVLAGVSAGIPLVAAYGVSGAFLGIHVSCAVAAAMMASYYRKLQPARIPVGGAQPVRESV